MIKETSGDRYEDARSINQQLNYDVIMLDVSALRNQNLANMFYRLKLIEAYGTGILKINGNYVDWSECNYRIWKNPVISMVLAQQARGFYPKKFNFENYAAQQDNGRRFHTEN